MLAAIPFRIEWLAALTGLAASALFLLTWQVGGETRVPAAAVELVTSSTGELDVTPPGVTSDAASLRASREVALTRELSVLNATALPRDVRFGATPDHGELNRALHVAIKVNGTRLFSGTLDHLRGGSDAFRLEAGAAATVDVRVWIPEAAPADEWRARSVSIRLDLTSTEAR